MKNVSEDWEQLVKWWTGEWKKYKCFLIKNSKLNFLKSLTLKVYKNSSFHAAVVGIKRELIKDKIENTKNLMQNQKIYLVWNRF